MSMKIRPAWEADLASMVALYERFGFVKVTHFTEQRRKLGKYWDVGCWEKAI